MNVLSNQPIGARNAQRLAREDFDRSDGVRRRTLAEILRSEIVRATVYPGEEPTTVRHVYVHGATGPVFACVVWAQRRLREVIEDAPCVIEGFSLQVASGNALGGDALRTALGTWLERNFVRIRPPVFALEEWIEPPAELPAEWVLDASIADPPYEDAA